jgi:hypothetical protein
VSLLGEKVIALHESFDERGIPHAFGGALALAYCVRPARGTEDIDINVFLRPRAADFVLTALPSEVTLPPRCVEVIQRDAQVRLMWDHTPLDLFFNDVDLHDTMASRCRVVPFAETEIPVLSCTDLAICKAMFSRPKDWVDIGAMAEQKSIDTGECVAWVARMMGKQDERTIRLREIFSEQP